MRKDAWTISVHSARRTEAPVRGSKDVAPGRLRQRTGGLHWNTTEVTDMVEDVRLSRTRWGANVAPTEADGETEAYGRRCCIVDGAVGDTGLAAIDELLVMVSSTATTDKHNLLKWRCSESLREGRNIGCGSWQQGKSSDNLWFALQVLHRRQLVEC